MSKRIKLIGGIAATAVVAFLAIQLVPVWALQTNPPVVSEPKWDSPQTRALAQRACFDCHSNETVWPWYSHVAPVSWLTTLNTLRGRRSLNFSEWNSAAAVSGGEGFGGRRGVRDMGEKILSGEMPPADYVLLHPNAQLTDAEKQQLIAGLQASLK